MGHPSTDPEGYYELLRLPPGADLQKVEAAYAALLEEWQLARHLPRYRLQEAYRVLSDPAQKSRYDAHCRAGEEIELTSRTRSVVLGAILTLLFFQASFVFPGFLLPGPRPFRTGDLLVQHRTRTQLGHVVRREHHHRFPGGKHAPAYLIRLSHGSKRWYPAGDLERHYSQLLDTTRPDRR